MFKFFQLVTIFSILFGWGKIYAQAGALTGFCSAGATSAITSGLASSNTLQGIVPSCLVTVYTSGTTNKATIYSNLSGGTLNNPFTATTKGQWTFYAALGSYDIVLIGGTPPITYANPVTLTGLNIFYPQSSIQTNPSGNQTVTQPVGTTLAVNSLNTAYYVSPTSGVDIATQIASIFSTCGTQCVVHIPCGTYTSSASTIQMNNPYEAIVGDGEGCVFITYSGATFLNWNNSGGTAGFSFYASTGVGGFTLTCTSTTAQCITAGSVIGANFHDMSLYGPGGIVSQSPAGTAQGFVLASTSGDWFERWVMRNIHIGGFQVNTHFEAGGTGSFGYGLMDGVWNNIGYQNIALQVDAGASVYNTLGFKFQVNSGGTGGVCNCTYLSVAGELQGVGFAMTGENAGNTGVTAIHSVNGGLVSFQGDSNLYSGGLVQDQACGTYSDIQCIYISPRAALNGVLGGISSEMTTTNGLTTHPLVVYATDYFDNSNPYLVAETGYIYDSTASASTPFVAYDPRTSLCDYTRAYGGSGYSPSALTWSRCLDGAGNQTNAGFVKGVTGAFGATTLNALSVGVSSLSSQNASIYQTGTSTYGLWNSLSDSMAGSWNYGVSSQFMPNIGAFYVESGVDQSETSTPEFQVVSGYGVVTPNAKIGDGARTVYVCTTAGTLPVGALTTASGNCGASVSTLLTVN